MTDFKIHTLETVPEAGRETLEAAVNAYGFIPNLTATMVESPALAKAYKTIGSIFDETTFDATEKQVVLLTVSRFNGCEYCVAAHSVIASMGNVAEEVVAAIRDDEPIGDPRLQALRQFVHRVTETRGWPDAADIQEFFVAGYGREHVLEIVLGIAMKTMSNYTNHIAGTPLDDAFETARWSAPESNAA